MVFGGQTGHRGLQVLAFTTAVWALAPVLVRADAPARGPTRIETRRISPGEEVQQALNGFAWALRARNGRHALRFLTRESLQTYEDIRTLALDGSPAALRRQPPSRRMAVLLARQHMPRDQLLRMSSGDFVARAVQEQTGFQIFLDPSLEYGRPRVRGSVAKVPFKYQGFSNRRLQLELRREDDQWKLHVSSVMAVLDEALKQLARAQGVPVDRLVDSLIRQTGHGDGGGGASHGPASSTPTDPRVRAEVERALNAFSAAASSHDATRVFEYLTQGTLEWWERLRQNASSAGAGEVRRQSEVERVLIFILRRKAGRALPRTTGLRILTVLINSMGVVPFLDGTPHLQSIRVEGDRAYVAMHDSGMGLGCDVQVELRLERNKWRIHQPTSIDAANRTLQAQARARNMSIDDYIEQAVAQLTGEPFTRDLWNPIGPH